MSDSNAPGETEPTHAWSLATRMATMCGYPVTGRRMESAFQPLTCGACEQLRSLLAIHSTRTSSANTTD